MVKHAISDGEQVILSTYLGGTACACGTAVTAVTPTSGATSAVMRSVGGYAYYAINGTAGTTSPGHIPSGSVAYIAPIDNLNSLSFMGEAATVVHIEFYDEFQESGA